MIIPTMLLADLVWWFCADRWLRRTKRQVLWRSMMAVFMTVQLTFVVWMIVHRDSARNVHLWVPSTGMAVIYIWHMIVLPVTIVGLALYGIGRGLWWGGKQIVKGVTKDPPPASEALSAQPSRRQLLAGAAAALPPLITLAAVGRSAFQLHDFRIRRLDLPLKQLPRSLDGLTIAHVTDVHVGRFTRSGMLPAIADATNKLKADLVLLTGDLIDLSMADLPAGLDMVNKLDPRSGLFMCEGNHDLIHDRLGFEVAVKKSGVPILLDESRIIHVRGEPVQVMGIRWMRAQESIDRSVGHITRQLQPGAFPILLAHHPHAFDPATAAGIPLTLAGHTHGGQLMLNEQLGFGPVMFKYWTGLYRKQDSALVVSNGVGNWFPIRVNAPAEILHVTLRRV